MTLTMDGTCGWLPSYRDWWGPFALLVKRHTLNSNGQMRTPDVDTCMWTWLQCVKSRVAKSRTGFIFASHYKERRTSFYLRSDLKPNKCSWGMFFAKWFRNDTQQEKKKLLGKYNAFQRIIMMMILSDHVHTLHLAFKSFLIFVFRSIWFMWCLMSP